MNRQEARESARALVARMTLEEKASQLRYDAPAIDRLGIPAYNWWNEALHGVARAGTATVFPQAIGLAAIFDEDFHEAVARVIADEGRAKYNLQSRHDDRDIYKGLTFWSPNINIFRDPRWGRGQETYGEDPHLTARLGVRFVKGLQGHGEYLKTAACAKHYAVHSGPEAIRHSFDAIASKKDMEETYLPAFEALVKEAGVEAVMPAYNRVNGEPACGSKTLLLDILRGKWGFEGHVVSDCWAIRDFHTQHHVTDTAPESAALALQNGCDLNCGNTYLHLMQAVREGLVTEAQITLAAERAFTTRFLLGLFADDCEYDAIDPLAFDTDKNAALALEAARKSMVLLKNDGVLPLCMDSLKTIAVLGPNADSRPCLYGNYNGASSRYVTFLEGIRAACGGKARVLYSEGCHLYKKSLSGLSQPDDRIAEAVGMAEHADVVILCVGLDATLEGEEGDTGNEYSSGDKNTLELPECQRTLLSAVLAAGKPVVTVLAAGSAMRVTEGSAVLWTGYPGQAGGTALAELLFGKVSPSGKLPVTFYHSAADLPDFTDYSMRNRTYRYYGGKALYPFGFGLGYARFAYSGAAYADGRVTVTVENTGGMDAEDVVQAYIKLNSRFAPPNPCLCAFTRIALKKGERKRVSLAIAPQAFTSVNDEGERVREDGGFTLYIGASQPDAVSVALMGAEPLKINA
ncbi:MAG: glycoside hydrolase family 3 C-terminal domain-containing protein [Firmicutes bacterium]|nr:glycoside hydrolase family 3 C-terminal domain-containing protein [Bacillota bacterium]